VIELVLAREGAWRRQYLPAGKAAYWNDHLDVSQWIVRPGEVGPAEDEEMVVVEL